MDNNGPDPLEVPGFGDIPLHYTLDTDKTFDDGANGWTGWNQSPRLTARELAIVQLISRVTDIHKWYECVNNEQIVAQWREKALETPLISEKAWEWCVAELRDKAILFGSTKRVLNLDTGTSISKSDEVPSGIRESFITEIASVYEGSLSQEQGTFFLTAVLLSIYALKFTTAVRTCYSSRGVGIDRSILINDLHTFRRCGFQEWARSPR